MGSTRRRECLTANQTTPGPRRGEVWEFDPEPTMGHELGKKRRPCIIVSNDNFNGGTSGMTIVVPLTSTIAQGQTLHHTVRAPEGGLTNDSDACCEQVRAISVDRLTARLGTVSNPTLLALSHIMRKLIP